MADDIMTETPEEIAGMKALQDEAPIELVDPAPEPEPPPEPEAKPEPKAAEPEPKKPVRLVPHEALHEERVKRQALERRLADMEKAQPPRQQASPASGDDIDENENPLGAIAALKAKLKLWETQAEESTRQQDANRQISARMAPRVEAYAKEHPEYVDQFQYVRASRAEELSLLGYAPEQIAQSLHAEEMDLARRTIENDLDPGDVIAKLAKARGWRAKEPVPEPKKEATLDPDASKKIERLQAGTRAAKSSSAGGGSGPEAEMTLERLASLDGAAFDAAFAKNGQRLLGG